MRLKIVNTGSAGNCYLFEASDKQTLIVEVGVNFLDIKKAVNFNLGYIVGALVTHEHGDHAKALGDVVKAGIPAFASNGTITASGIIHHRITEIKAHKAFKIGAFQIYPFDVNHDAKEPLGFVISHPECGNVLFITDTYYVGYKFENINNILIEANFSESIVAEKRAMNDSKAFVYDRVLRSHMSIETCRTYLNSMDLKAVNQIVLIHLSNGNSHAKEFKKEIELSTGKDVWIADKGLEIELNKTPF